MSAHQKLGSFTTYLSPFNTRTCNVKVRVVGHTCWLTGLTLIPKGDQCYALLGRVSFWMGDHLGMTLAICSQGWRNDECTRLPTVWPGVFTDLTSWVGCVCCWVASWKTVIGYCISLSKLLLLLLLLYSISGLKGSTGLVNHFPRERVTT